MTQTRRRHGGVDRFARRLGIQTVQGRSGRSRLRLRVASSMVNVYGVAHGGVVFALADAAFAAFYAMTVTGRAGRAIATCQGVVHRRPAGSERPGARPGLWRESS